MSGSVAPRDPDFERRVRSSFSKQAFMTTLGARLEFVRPGDVLISLPFDVSFTQQHGLLHAGAVASVLDSACGYAALSLASAGAGVLSVEFKVNLLLPAQGERFFARGTAIRSGRTLSVCQSECRADDAESGKLLAIMQATIMSLEDREGIRDE